MNSLNEGIKPVLDPTTGDYYDPQTATFQFEAEDFYYVSRGRPDLVPGLRRCSDQEVPRQLYRRSAAQPAISNEWKPLSGNPHKKAGKR